MSGRGLKPEERQIWRKVTRSVTPLHMTRDEPKEDLKPASREPVTTGLGQSRPATKRNPVVPAVKPPPADRSAERKLRRGRVEIDARIDLHGMTQIAARTSLGHFLHAARSRGFRAVLVITGKGKVGTRNREPGEEAPGVIRRRFPEWLAEPELRHLISGYASAHRRHGGEGAFYVMIRTG
jgi:DNA-nicking Smr family endonuclease